MSTIETSAVEKLKASLSTSSSVVTPDSENYERSHKRWSEGAEKKAVSTELRLQTLTFTFPSIHL
jgi:hypothetical protein